MRWPWTKDIPERKDSKTGPAIYMQTLGRPAWTPRNYEQLAREAYVRNSVAHRCVRLISEAASSMPILVFEGDDELEEHPFLDLIRRPNPFEGKSDLLDRVYSFLLLSGNSYLEAVQLDGNIRELYSLRPDRMKVVPGRRGYPTKYEYTVGQTKVTYDVDVGPGKQLPILHLKLFHPIDDHYGMSPVEAAAFAIDVHNSAGAFNKALLDNQARPSGALIYQGGDGKESLTDEQFTRLKKELEEKYQGSRNAGRPLLLDGGLDWKEMGMSPKDLEFVEGKREASREIALAFGVPPMLLGIPGDNTYSNYREANRVFYRQTVIPLVMQTLEAMTTFFTPTFGEEFELRTDLDSLEALSDERKDLWDRVNNAKFLTVDEKREAAGYDQYEPGEGIGSHIYAPVSEGPLMDETFEPGGSEPDDPEPEETEE